MFSLALSAFIGVYPRRITEWPAPTSAPPKDDQAHFGSPPRASPACKIRKDALCAFDNTPAPGGLPRLQIAYRQGLRKLPPPRPERRSFSDLWPRAVPAIAATRPSTSFLRGTRCSLASAMPMRSFVFAKQARGAHVFRVRSDEFFPKLQRLLKTFKRAAYSPRASCVIPMSFQVNERLTRLFTRTASRATSCFSISRAFKKNGIASA